jgi:WD repeat-containing protein 89
VFDSESQNKHLSFADTSRMAEQQKLLLESPQLQEENVPHLSANSASGSYILSITSLSSHYAALASAPANVIDLFDKTTLKAVLTLPGHGVATTSLHTVNNVAGVANNCLISSGKDGSVKIWDHRSNSHSIKSKFPFIC